MLGHFFSPETEMPTERKEKSPRYRFVGSYNYNYP